ncbi:type 1 fimbrial protein [Aeromonas veronii]|uniref:fimbrial protein n=1 Tax=Aeromonas veronii TaxID=654 RepID=UPI00214D9CB5|nr:fimbrial protein [Aeromonas veronii]MCR3970918.1 type 1 fimbrial protein [Aeromonas veronii]MCR3975246.1 type 1 fimbrial protein [Aeromonas veronii]
MNKKIINLGLLVAFSMSAVTAHAASSGTININGLVIGSTCDVAVDGGAADATVNLRTLPNAALGTAGLTAGKTDFVMSLTHCTTTENVAAFFRAGATVENTTGRLKQMATGASAAKNVSLQLRDGFTDKPIFVGNSSQISDNHFEAMSGDPTQEIRLTYEVEYYAEDAVTPGQVSSQVVYNLLYK